MSLSLMAFFLYLITLVVSVHAYYIHRDPAATAADVIPPAQFSLPLTGRVPRPTYKRSLCRAQRRRAYTAILAGTYYDEEYVTDVTIGGQNFKVMVDTGSSDTWLAQTGFQCFNASRYPVQQSSCAFGSSGFDESKSKTFVSSPDENLNITYGGGEFLTGGVGFDTITVGGMTVTRQEFGLVNSAGWAGDGVNSGILGLAFPGLTNIYSGTDPIEDATVNRDIYSPFFFTAVSQKVVSKPYFSVSLNRGSWDGQKNSTYDENLGYLAFGGMAPVQITNTAVTVPVQGYVMATRLSVQYTYYAVEIDMYVFDGSTMLTGSGKHAILDTGTWLNYLPTALAAAYNAKFVPPATYIADQDTYYVDCNATAPSFAVEIGGAQFVVDAVDSILPVSTDSNGNEICISGTQNGGDPSNPRNIFTLGSAFLHNVVATFDIQSKQITITQRTAY